MQELSIENFYYMFLYRWSLDRKNSCCSSNYDSGNIHGSTGRSCSHGRPPDLPASLVGSVPSQWCFSTCWSGLLYLSFSFLLSSLFIPQIYCTSTDGVINTFSLVISCYFFHFFFSIVNATVAIVKSVGIPYHMMTFLHP